MLSLKRLVTEEDNGAGPPPEGDGGPGGGPPTPTRSQELREGLLELEEIIKQIEVTAEGRGQGQGPAQRRPLKASPPTGDGGGVLSPATGPISAQGRHCPPAWLHLRPLSQAGE